MATKKYQCSNCLKIFDKKSHYVSHLGRKRPCIKKEISLQQNTDTDNVDSGYVTETCGLISKKDKDIEQTKNAEVDKKHIDEDLTCVLCHKKFTRKDIRDRHLRDNCKIRRKLSNEVEEAIKKILAENSSLREENRKLKDKKGNTTYNILNAYINNNTYNNVKLAAYGHEDTSYITPTHYSEIFNHGKNAIPIFIKFLHFNKKHPENNNIFISNIHDDYVLIFNGHKWMLHQRDKALDDVYFDSVSTLDDVYHKQIKNNPDSVVIRFEEFLEKHDDDKIANDIKTELKLLFYNYKDIVENTKKQTITNGEPIIV
jgi:hypothetical protein